MMYKKTFNIAYGAADNRQRAEVMEAIASRLGISTDTLQSKRTGKLGLSEEQQEVVRQEFRKAGILKVFDDEYGTHEQPASRGKKRAFAIAYNSLMSDEKEEVYNMICQVCPMQHITFDEKKRGYKPLQPYLVDVLRHAFKTICGYNNIFDDELSAEEIKAMKRRHSEARMQYTYQCAYKMMCVRDRKVFVHELSRYSGKTERTLEYKRIGRLGMTTGQAEEVRNVYRQVTGSEIVFDRFQSQKNLERYGKIYSDSDRRQSCPFNQSFDELDRAAKKRVIERVSYELLQSEKTLYQQKRGGNKITPEQKEVIRAAMEAEGVEKVFDEERGVKIPADHRTRLERDSFRKMVTRGGLYGYYKMPQGYNHLLGYPEGAPSEKKNNLPNNITVGYLENERNNH